MHPPYFENTPSYGRLITLPKGRPHFQVHELVEYGDEIIRNPMGRAWQQGRIIMEIAPGNIYELVSLDGVHGFQSPKYPTPTNPVQAKQQSSLFAH